MYVVMYLVVLMGTSMPQCNAQPQGGGPGPVEGDLRLADGDQGPGYEYGRLEVFVGGRWGNVCNELAFTPDSAQVACRQLGYDGGARLQWLQTTVFGDLENVVLLGTAPVLMSDVDCDGTETRLADCPATTTEEAQACDPLFGDPLTDLRGVVLGCSTSAPAACNASALEEEGALRLRGGAGSPCDPLHSGFVEVFHNGEWGAVTGSARDSLVPRVACQQLGFPHGTRLNPVGSGGGPPLPPVQSDYFASYFSPDDRPVEEAEEPVGRVWLTGVSCTGPEARLVDCELGRARGAIQQLGPGEATRVTVACRTFPVEAALEAVTTPGAEEGQLRLVNQTAVENWVQGRLEVFFGGSWSQVCGFAFDAADAQVACRQLQSTAGTVLSTFSTETAAPARKPLVFPRAAITKSGCSGSEARLVDCPVDAVESNFVLLQRTQQCFNTEEPGLHVACVADPLPGVEEGSIRLQNQQQEAGGLSGVLEIFHAGAWGTVCDAGALFFEISSEVYNFGDYYYTGINPSAGSVACRELGFTGGEFEDLSQSMEDASSRPSWVGNLLCVGDEDLLRDCPGVVFGGTAGCGATQRLTCSQ